MALGTETQMPMGLRNGEDAPYSQRQAVEQIHRTRLERLLLLTLATAAAKYSTAIIKRGEFNEIERRRGERQLQP